MNQIFAFIFGAICVFSLVNDSAGVKTCSDDEYVVIRKNGRIRCKPCKCEGGGIGFDTNVTREENEYGYTTCYPCSECPEGYYRSYDDVSSYCNICRLDCVGAFRLESVRCGGDTVGHCGDCLPGLKPESSEANSVCGTDPEEVWKSTIPAPEPKSAQSVNGSNDDKTYVQVPPVTTEQNSESDESGEWSSLAIILSFGLLVTIVFTVGLIVCLICKECKKRCGGHTSHGTSSVLGREALSGHSACKLLSDSQQTNESRMDIAAVVPSSMSEKPTIVYITDEGEFDDSVKFGNGGCDDYLLESKKPLLDDLTMDGPDTEDIEKLDQVEVEGQEDNKEDTIDDGTNDEDVVRGELPSTQSVTEGCALMPSSEVPDAQKKESCPAIRKEVCYTYYNRQLNENDETITRASTGIFSERRYELFETYLKLEKAKIDPMEELWRKNPDGNGFDSYILNCLKYWLRKNGSNADLDWLITSLKQADFQDLALQILELSENKFPDNYAENDTNIKTIEL
ncbi:hypothetical protein ACF0H5_010359 [Mactra antiquata]